MRSELQTVPTAPTANPVAVPAGQAIEDHYNRIGGDEDARVCKDIPDAAYSDQPRSFFAYLRANLLGKIADDIASTKRVIAWLFGALGVPETFTGFLVRSAKPASCCSSSR